MRAPSDPLGGGDPVSDGALLVHGEEDQPAGGVGVAGKLGYLSVADVEVDDIKVFDSQL